MFLQHSSRLLMNVKLQTVVDVHSYVYKMQSLNWQYTENSLGADRMPTTIKASCTIKNGICCSLYAVPNACQPLNSQLKLNRWD